ncbi:disrupted in schizophrenia 1 protein isoform X2 [Salmo salar]|uniref:Disrupted in schizophrenia 1 protein isoform X2 n=1 Tax=Salmo salar TaxID=8030 RepID=A0ABM3E5U4_SALSA|nr:disrupted in schizophrenia 1 protein isoform X2 [Salmo salar]
MIYNYTDRSDTQHHHWEGGMEGGLGKPTSSAGSSTCKRLQQLRRPEYLRTELPRLQSTLAGEEGRTACLTNGASGCHGMNRQNGHSDVMKTSTTLRRHVPPAGSVSQQLSPLDTYKPSLRYQNNHFISSSPTPPLLSSSPTLPLLSSSPPLLLSSPTPPLLSTSPPPLSQEEGCCVTKFLSSDPQASFPSPQSDFSLTPGSIPLQPCLLSPNPRSSSASSATQFCPPNSRPRSPNSRTCLSGSTGSRSPQPTCHSTPPPSGDTLFSSSFSFIQQSLSLDSLSSSHRTDTDTAAGERPSGLNPDPLNSSPGLNPDPQPLNSSPGLNPDPQPLNSSPGLNPDPQPLNSSPGLNPDPQPLNSSPGLNPDPQPLNSSPGLDRHPLDQSSARSLRTGSVPYHSEPLEWSGSVPPCQLVSAPHDQLLSGSSSDQSRLGVLGLSLGLSVSKLSTPSRVQSEPGSVPHSQSDGVRDRLSPWVWQDRHWEGRERAGPGLQAELPSSVTSDMAEVEPDCDSSSLDTEASSSLSVAEDSDAATASSLTSGYESATPTTATASSLTSGYESATPTTATASSLTSGYESATPTTATASSLTSGYESATPTTATASSLTSGYESATPTTATAWNDCVPDQDQDQDQAWDQLVKKYEGVLQDCLHNNRTNTKIESMMAKLQRLKQKAILEDEYDSAEHFGKKLEELGRERSSLRLGLPSRQPSVALFLQRLREAVHSALARMEDHRDEVESDGGEVAETVQGPLQRRECLLQEKRMVEAEMAELQWRLGELQSRSCSLEHQIQQEEEDLQTEEVEGPALRSCSHTQLRDMGNALNDLVTSQSRTRIRVSPPEAILRLQDQEQTLSLSIKDATAKVVMSQRLGGSLRRKVSETETQLLALHEAKLAAISGNAFSSAKELKAEMRAVYGERDRLELLVKRLHRLSFGNSQDLAKMKTQQQQLKLELEARQAQHERTLKENVVKYIELLEDRLHSCGCPPLQRIWEADLEACHLLLRGIQLRTPFCGGPAPATVVLPNPQPATKQEADLQECAMLTALGGRWCPEANLQNSEFTKEDSGSEAAELTADVTIELTDQCEEISDRLLVLEDDLQTAILNKDQDLTQSLEQEVREVKATLHTMLTQLNEEEEKDNEIMEEENEEVEDQYFSDSWEI